MLPLYSDTENSHGTRKSLTIQKAHPNDRRFRERREEGKGSEGRKREGRGRYIGRKDANRGLN